MTVTMLGDRWIYVVMQLLLPLFPCLCGPAAAAAAHAAAPAVALVAAAAVAAAAAAAPAAASRVFAAVVIVVVVSYVYAISLKLPSCSYKLLRRISIQTCFFH